MKKLISFAAIVLFSWFFIKSYHFISTLLSSLISFGIIAVALAVFVFFQ